MQKTTPARNLAIIIATSGALITATDLALKHIAIKTLPESGGFLHPVIDFALHKNAGIAFNLAIPLAIVIPLTLAIITILTITAIKTIKSNPIQTAFLSLVISGAAGNLIDRILNNFTTDYIILFRTSAINLADVLIITGAITTLWYNKHTNTKHS